MSDFNLGEVLRGQLKGVNGAPAKSADFVGRAGGSGAAEGSGEAGPARSGAFDGGVSNLDTSDAREQIEYIDIEKIGDDPKNFYALSGLEELAANIELLGLQQPLRVRADPEAPDRVIVVSGHRRLAALKKLTEEGREDLREVPCIRERTEGSAALQELRLIYANSGTRVLTSAELSRQAERVELLLYQLKEEGMEFPGRMRDHVAQACRVSAPKLARLKVIREGLAPEYMELFEKDKLPEQTAHALARLPREFQQRLASVLSEVPVARTAEKVLEKYGEGWRWEPELSCPDGKVCKRGDIFLRRDCETSGWQSFCGGKTCCLECEQAKATYSPCERMCSKAKAQRKAANDETKEKELQRKRKEGRKCQKETQGYAKRLLRAIDAAGLAEDTKIRWEYPSQPVSIIRQWAAGEFDDPADWYSPRLRPDKCYEPVEMAKLLGCSTDFLMGLTDELRPPEAPPQNELELETKGDASAETQQAEAEDELPVSSEEESPRLLRWESGVCTPPVGGLILTYNLTNVGAQYRAAIWDGARFLNPGNGKELTGLQYTSWLEVPLPDSGETFQTAPFSGWMPGGLQPEGPCEVVADFHISEENGSPGKDIRCLCRFDGTAFLFYNHDSKIDAECLRWMPLPPTEDVSKLDTIGEAGA